MLREPGIPLLPGTLFRDITKTKFPRSQHWNHLNGVPLLSERKQTAFAGGPRYDPDFPPYCAPPALYPSCGAPKEPAWLAYDKQILCFYGYFKENLHEVYRAPYIIRKVKIYFYLEDGTIKVTEPPVLNSGIPQGCLISRQRIPKNPRRHDEFISVLDLNVDKDVRIYDRIIHITDCDRFTREFLNKAGIHVPESLDSPIDPGTEIRRRSAPNSYPRRPKTSSDKFGQFLKFDRYILRFFGYWEDRSEFGDIRELEIHYYLADNTVEIKEILPVNSGRAGPTMFLKRQKLPKEWHGLPQPGQNAPVTILNVLGGGLRGGRYINDALGTVESKESFYAEQDLQIGAHINVFGRDVVLCSCDGFTQDYYQKKYGTETFTPLPIPKKQRLPPAVHPRHRELPPFNGWGTHEDSEGNCITVEPKPPQPDFQKFLNLDRRILRFGAKMISRIKENCERLFVVSYHLSDDTISVFELALRNSGFTGGEFFKRDRFLLPNQEILTPKRPDTFKPYHLYLGATLTLKDHVFHLISADEYTLNYMEDHPYEFPLADIETIMTKIREVLRPQYKNFIAQYFESVQVSKVNGQNLSTINADVIQKALTNLLGPHITEHEIITVCRYFSVENVRTPACNRETVRATAHAEIIRNLWDDLKRLKEHIYHIDPECWPYLPEKKIRSIIYGCRLPFNKELLESVISVLNRNESNEIEVCDFINFIDVKNRPAPPAIPINVAFELCSKMPTAKSGNVINWDRLLQKINLEAVLKHETD